MYPESVLGKPTCAKCQEDFLPDENVFIIQSVKTVSFKDGNFRDCHVAWLAHKDYSEMGMLYNLKYVSDEGESNRRMLSFCEKCFHAIAGENFL